MSAIVVGELLFGFRYGPRYEKNRAILEEFLESAFVELVPVTMETADRFGILAAELRRKGTPLPTNDVWIAAHVLESGSTLITSDSHFGRIENLPWRQLRKNP